MDNFDIYELFFIKMSKIGFPIEYKSFLINYDFQNYQAEILIKNIEAKIYIMRKLLNEWKFIKKFGKKKIF